MPDTPRTLAALQALLADNTAAAISPQDIRDFLVSCGLITGTGELGGTADAPTVTTVHSGSSHAAAQAAAEATAAAALTAHEGAADPHAGYMTPAEHTAVGDGSPHHAAATAGADGEHSFVGQVISGTDAAAAQKGHIQLAGDLGGTAASPSVNATHAGSAHHAQSHAHNGADGSGTVAHSATTGQTANDHHAQSHGNADHTTAFTDDTTVNNHIADAVDAHDASAISILDTADDFTATDVEGALAELQSDNEAHVAAADPHTGYYLADGSRRLTGGATLDGIAAPGTPASDDIVVYNETATDLLKAKEDNGAVYALTHKHELATVVDGSTASTTAPYSGIRVPHAGVITGIFVKTLENITIGATSWIGDVHLVPVANANTDGQGTTIYTTQANRPTISNGNMYQAATAPDVTAFAAGDYLMVYTDQAGSSATFISVAIEVRYT